MSALVSALFSTSDSATRGIAGLLELGYAKEEVGVVLSDALKNRAWGPAEQAESAAKTQESIAIGGVLGLSIASVVTVGAFAALGPFAAVLASLGGGMAGSLAGAVVGDHLPKHSTKQVEARLSDGGILVGVYLTPPHEKREVESVLAKAGGEFVETG
jgi:hypothetical protein